MRSDVRQLLDEVESLDFIERRWSFVRSLPDRGLFLKVCKATPSTSLRSALHGTEERRIAGNEVDTLRSLSNVSPRIVPNVMAGDGAIVITEYVPETVSVSQLLRKRDLGRAAGTLAQLGSWLRTFHVQAPGTVIDGLKLDNVYVRPDGQPCLFDPNELMPGEPVVDLGRFMTSVLAAGYERGSLPSAKGIAACLAFLSGYGAEIVAPPQLAVEANHWRRRLATEMRESAARRWPRTPRAVPGAWIGVHSRVLERRIDQLCDAIVGRTGYDRMGTRYSDPAAVQLYRAQQERLSVKGVRLGLLARAERLAIRSLLPRASDHKRILDVPGGTGKLWGDLTQAGYSVSSVDRSEEMLRAAPRRGDVPLMVGDAARLPFSDFSFTGVVSLRLLHRVPSAEREAIFAEYARVATGWILFSYTDSSGLLRLRYKLRSMLSRGTDWAPFPASRAGMQAELAFHGLHIVSRRTVMGLLSNEVVILADRRVRQHNGKRRS